MNAKFFTIISLQAGCHLFFIVIILNWMEKFCLCRIEVKGDANILIWYSFIVKECTCEYFIILFLSVGVWYKIRPFCVALNVLQI